MAQKITLNELRRLVMETISESAQDSKSIRKWWNSLSPSKQQELVEKHLPNNEFGALAVDDNDLEIMYAKENEKLDEYFGGSGIEELSAEGLNIKAVLSGLSVLRASRPELFFKYFPDIYDK